MMQSHVIEVDGRFVAAAVRHEAGYRFVAIDPRVEDLDGSVWPTVDHARRLAGSLIHAGRMPEEPRSIG
jgi:hypothetical protein